MIVTRQIAMAKENPVAHIGKLLSGYMDKDKLANDVAEKYSFINRVSYIYTLYLKT